MEVVLNDFGVMQDKEFLKVVKGMSEFEWRTSKKVISLIKKRQNEIIYLKKLEEEKRITATQYIRLLKLTEYEGDWSFFTIKEVDTSRKWCIYDYHSSTSIQYLDIVDESTNFYGFI